MNKIDQFKKHIDRDFLKIGIAGCKEKWLGPRSRLMRALNSPSMRGMRAGTRAYIGGTVEDYTLRSAAIYEILLRPRS